MSGGLAVLLAETAAAAAASEELSDAREPTDAKDSTDAAELIDAIEPITPANAAVSKRACAEVALTAVEKVVLEAGENVGAETFAAVILGNALKRLLEGGVGNRVNEPGAVAEEFAALVVTARTVDDAGIEELVVMAEALG